MAEAAGSREVVIVPASRADPLALADRVRERWGGDVLIAHGDALYPARLPGFVALVDGVLAGHAAYAPNGVRCELVAIEVERSGVGLGSRLLAAVVDAARTAGCSTLEVTTTNDNLDALGFYQRRRFRLVALRPGAVDESRATRKPGIPETGPSGIAIRDELDLELAL